MRKSAREALNRPFEDRWARGPAKRACDQPGCGEAGEYRAPRSPERLNEYYWFCLEHVRAYNRAWNYFAGMSEAEIEAELRRDSCWDRPSWPFASVGAGRFRHGTGAFRDDFGFFHEEQDAEAGARRQWQRYREEAEAEAGRATTTAESRALAELDLEPPVDFETIKARYKNLVKQLHPDVAAPEDGADQDKLKAVNQAYATLRAAYGR